MDAVLLGFIIAAAIGLTGVGGGTITTPLLILVLKMKGAVAVGTALTFAAVIKFLVAPMYVFRKQVSWKMLAFMSLGGLPGVIIGGRALVVVSKQVNPHVLYLILGITIMFAAILNVYRLLKAQPDVTRDPEHPKLLAAFMFPVGAEVGFSSAGSGALGSLALLGLTRLDAAKVVGTDICFGLVLSIIGSGIQIVAGNYNGGVLIHLLEGGAIGAFVGGFAAQKIPSRPMKWALAIWLAALGCQLFVRGIQA
jgi:uncharacterized membrane protein YfcA